MFCLFGTHSCWCEVDAVVRTFSWRRRHDCWPCSWGSAAVWPAVMKQAIAVSWLVLFFSLVSMLFIRPVFALILYLVLYAYTIYSTYFSIFMSFIWEWCDCDHIIKWCQCWSFFWKKLCSHFCLNTTNRSTVFTEIMDSKFKTSTN